MSAPFTRASLSRGAAFGMFNGAYLYLRGDLDTKIAPVFNPVNSSLTGQIDKTKKDLVIKNTIQVFGLMQDLPLLFPSWLVNPAVGSSVFGSSDLALEFFARNNDYVIYPNTQITKLLGLHLGVDSELYSAALELTSIIMNGANPEDASPITPGGGVTLTTNTPYFGRGTKTFAAPASLALTNFVKTRWSAAWTGKTGLTSFIGQKGFDLSWNVDLKPCEVEGWGTVDMTVSEGGVIGQCKAIPIGPTGAQIDTAQAVNSAHGGLLSASGADLTLTGGTHSLVLKGAGLLESGTVFGIEPLRSGEALWETTRGLAAGVVSAVATIS